MSLPVITIEFPAAAIKRLEAIYNFPDQMLPAIARGMDLGIAAALGPLSAMAWPITYHKSPAASWLS